MTLDEKYPNAERFTFGDSPGLCDHLLGLIRAGHKRATCGALRDFQDGGEALPVVGRCDVALHWDGTPALVIRTVKVQKIRFCDVTAQMALAEGEDADLAGWQSGHRAYFTRNGGWSADMMLVFEHFELVEVL